MNSFLMSLPSLHLSSPPYSPLFSLPPLLSFSPAPCVQSHIMRHHSQLAVKPPQDSLHPPHTPHNPAQPKDTQALVPAGDIGRHIKRESSKSVLPAGLVAVVTRDDLIGKVHMNICMTRPLHSFIVKVAPLLEAASPCVVCMCCCCHPLLPQAKSVLQSLLSEHYHQIARRRRLRAVTAEELPWRAEVGHTTLVTLSRPVYECAVYTKHSHCLGYTHCLHLVPPPLMGVSHTYLTLSCPLSTQPYLLSFT